MKRIVFGFLFLLSGCAKNPIVPDPGATPTLAGEWRWYWGTDYGAFFQMTPVRVQFHAADTTVRSDTFAAGPWTYFICGRDHYPVAYLHFIAYDSSLGTSGSWDDSLSYIRPDSLIGVHFVPWRNTPIFDVFVR